jgi:endonuclease/exonuclease/phosphatase family metal-dependent hydrolase
VFYELDNFIRRIRRSFSISEWAISHFCLPVPGDAAPEKPGLLLIQIDGLSRTQFQKAIQRGKMPFLRRLLRKQHYEQKTFYSGVPSTTPSVQAELFYGVCCAVPAFAFLDRKAKRLATMFQPESVKPIEADLQKRGQGLLRGGSSWSNIYCGGASQDESHICAASIGWGEMLRSRSCFSFGLITLMQLPAVLRIIGLIIVEIFLGLWDVIEGVLRYRVQFFREFRFICNRMFITIGLREVVVLGAKIDLARGLPIIHTNFLGYDEQSHRRGPGSAFAHWSLRGIDKAIQRLYLGAHRSHRRDYQVWIFSDHGQELTRPYREIYEGGLEQAVRDASAKLHHQITETAPRKHMRHSPADWFGGRRAAKHFASHSEWQHLTKEEEDSFVVACLGPLGHVYFQQKLTVDEKCEFAQWLIKHAKVPGALIKTGENEAIWILADRTLQVPGDVVQALPHEDGIDEEVAGDLLQLCKNKYSGDIIFTGWAPHRQPISFENERGAHAGMGPEETNGFVLVPANTRFPDAGKTFVRPGQLREAALHYLGREKFRSRPLRDQAPHFRVMTYNVHGCLGMDGKISPHRIARVIERFDPDIVALQEVDLHRLRSRNEDQVAIIAHDLGMHFHFSPTISAENEHYGDAILSRYPITIVRTGEIAKDPEGKDPEPRGAIWAKIEIDGVTLHFFNTHFGLGRYERAAQAMDLLGKKWIGGVEFNEPVILCGDFNMFPNSLPYRALASRLHDVQAMIPNFRALKTFSTASPVFRIDHIFVSGHFNVPKVLVPRTDLTRIASDHLPLVADLSFDMRHLETTPHPKPRKSVAIREQIQV